MLFARSDWLTPRWLASTIHLRATGARDFQLFRPLFLHKITLWSANYSACVVYTKTIIHLSVGESDGYLPPLRWIIVKHFFYCSNHRVKQSIVVVVLLFWICAGKKRRQGNIKVIVTSKSLVFKMRFSKVGVLNFLRFEQRDWLVYTVGLTGDLTYLLNWFRKLQISRGRKGLR